MAKLSMLKLGVLVSGRGSNLEALLKNKQAGKLKAEIKVVISNQSQAKALEIANNYGVKAVYVDPKDYANKEAYDLALLNILQEQGVTLVVLAGYLRIVSHILLDAYTNRIINIHPSLLPAFKGLNAQKQALDYGVKISGCTVHFVDAGLDSGKIIEQRAVEVDKEDTEDTLVAKILREEHQLLTQAINRLAEQLF
jgi:phosphoribosylglycinamide formyltransferase-1